MKKLFAAVAAWALVGCAGAREVRTEPPRPEMTLEERRERWDVIHASARPTPKKKAEAGIGGAGSEGGIDPVLLEPLSLDARAPESEGKKDGEAKRPARRPLQPGAVQPPPAD